jgi:hypothetical protein
LGQIIPSAPALLVPILSIRERLWRRSAFSSADPDSLLDSFAIRRFHPHVRGLDRFKGRKVLEIGGTPKINMKSFFQGIGAAYTNVRLESNKERDKSVMVGDFMDLSGKFDLVISLGVFEIGAIDVDFERMEAGIIKHSAPERAAKLSALTASGGHCLIGTISSPCFFSDQQLGAAGFRIIHRGSPFYSFMNPDNGDIYGKDDRSELILLEKKER